MCSRNLMCHLTMVSRSLFDFVLGKTKYQLNFVADSATSADWYLAVMGYWGSDWLMHQPMGLSVPECLRCLTGEHSLT